MNILGFTVGVALYALLGIMVTRYRRGPESSGVSGLLLLTAALGLVWNIGELLLVIQNDFTGRTSTPLVAALSYSALGFLPSVVVHSAQVGSRTTWLTYSAYALSLVAAVLHFFSLASVGAAPSYYGLIILTIGSVLLAAGLLIVNFRQAFESKAVFAAALLVFAVSALHLSGDGEESSWLVELVAHQSSLPLVLVILYQNYKFAFADLFLKRAISLVLLALVALGLYSFVAAPMLRYHETHDRNDALAVSLIITLWIATALVYPKLHDLAVWIVDRVILRRADYAEVQVRVAAGLEQCESIDQCLELVGKLLAQTLAADRFDIAAASDANISHAVTTAGSDRIEMTIPTAEPGFYRIAFSGIAAGRRLLSEEKGMILGVAHIAARRIDALRISHERYESEYREREFSRLATEAQLTALRSQINPHFLFNALTTVGYLIRNSPDKALQTLLHLTKLLRGVLTGISEFTSLREELTLIESYLDIERARFEERLEIVIDVPAELESIKTPSLLIQPLVENAIKHAVSENKRGGRVTISARLPDPETLQISVSDTGAGGIHDDETQTGTGLANIRERLAAYYGDRAALNIDISPDGTVASVTLPTKIDKPALRAA